ncbi:MAG: hypothetical protein F2MM_01240 [Candidatus Midichloria mitochondrii]
MDDIHSTSGKSICEMWNDKAMPGNYRRQQDGMISS